MDGGERAHVRGHGGEGAAVSRYSRLTWSSSTGSTPAATGRTASLGVNEFTDLTDEEFVARYTAAGYYSNATSFEFGVAAHKLPGFMYENVSLSSDGGYTQGIDWRERGAVTNVKNQGNCGN